MEGLESLSRGLFDSTQEFRAPPRNELYDTFEITANGTENEKRTEADLGPWSSRPAARNDHSPQSTAASLKLMRIYRNLDVSLNISKSAFTAIFTSMRADPSVLYMICRDYDGFHEYSTSRTAGNNTYLPTRFVGTAIHAVLWTFDPATSTTRALFINRRRDTFTGFCHVLSAFSGCIHTPHILCFAIALHQLHWFDVQTGQGELPIIRQIEERTGYGPNRSNPDGAPWHNLRLSQLSLGIDEITEWSQSIGEVAGNFANKLRHQHVAGQLLDTLVAARAEGGEATGIPAGPARESYERSMDTLCEAVPSIKRHMEAYAEFLKYLRDRAERLSGVLFALLTHEDAAAGVTLAAKAKRDASSMKTVAIMTMAFLPATFFAAVFSMPSLDWEKAGVVTWSFGVYWAFTIPVTALVFGIWLLIAHRKRIRARVEAGRGADFIKEWSRKPST